MNLEKENYTTVEYMFFLVFVFIVIFPFWLSGFFAGQSNFWGSSISAAIGAGINFGVSRLFRHYSNKEEKE